MSDSRFTSRAEADFSGIVLLTGIVTLDAAISWADQRILETDGPRCRIIELLLGTSRCWSYLEDLIPTAVPKTPKPR